MIKTMTKYWIRAGLAVTLVVLISQLLGLYDINKWGKAQSETSGLDFPSHANVSLLIPVENVEKVAEKDDSRTRNPVAESTTSTSTNIGSMTATTTRPSNHAHQTVNPSALQKKERSNHKGDRSTKGFSACLLIKDDNHFVIEWLAYHYHALPLRRLFVAVDPSSKTSPSRIFDRYRKHGLMEITEWTDSDFFAYESLPQATQIKYNLSEAVHQHKFRQPSFYLKCMAESKRENYTWTAMVDSDEYILPNQNAGPSANLFQIVPNSTKDSNRTVWDWIELGKKSNILQLISPCIPLVRLLIGGKESTHEEVKKGVPSEYNATNFVTMRYRCHQGLENFKANRLGKGMIDVSKVDDKELFFDNVYVHRPLRRYCTAYGMRMKNILAPFVTHHYLGSWEQWTYRDDPRHWTRRRTGQYARFSSGRETDDNARSWLQGFIQNVGSRVAAELLENVGELEPL